MKAAPHRAHATLAPAPARAVAAAKAAAPKASEGAPSGPQPGREYDPFEVGDFVSGWAGGVIGEQLTPIFIDWAARNFPSDKYPVFDGKYGPMIRSRSAAFAAGIASDVLAGPLVNGVRAALHGIAPNVAGEPGAWVAPPPPNAIASGLVKTITTGAVKTWLQTAWNPPTPPPAPPAGGSAASAAARDAAAGPTFLGRDLRSVGHDAAMTAVSMIISQVYDQVAGPFVQHSVNRLMGRGTEPVRQPRPINPGGMVSALASGVLSSFILNPIAWKGPGAGTPAAIIGASMVNGLIGSAFDSYYSRSLGPAIADTVNAVSGLPVQEREPATYPTERVIRSVARGAASGTAYYAASNLTTTMFAALGASLGGIPGAAVAMAGPVVSGLLASTVVDAVLGNAIGSLGGSVYEWLSGKPKSEHRVPVPEQPAAGGTEAAQAGAKAVVAMKRRRRSVETLTAAALATRVA